jgi:hypothetical protein
MHASSNISKYLFSLQVAVCSMTVKGSCAGLLEVFLTGGIPPFIDDPCLAESVYMATFRRVMVQNEKYYTRFPNDVKIVKDLVKFLANHPEGGIRTPSGNWLRPRTLQILGMSGKACADRTTI